MSWLIALAWVFSGIACWDRHERWCVKRNRCLPPLGRDVSRLLMMLMGPLIFVLQLLTVETEDGP